MITDQMECLDDYRAATTMISIDLEKAFNRVDHQNCLEKMAEYGASNETLSLTAGFLENRSMRIKTLTGYSTPRPMPGGAPQGTKCGNVLFCVTVMDIARNTGVGEDGRREEMELGLGLRNIADRL